MSETHTDAQVFWQDRKQKFNYEFFFSLTILRLIEGTRRKNVQNVKFYLILLLHVKKKHDTIESANI